MLKFIIFTVIAYFVYTNFSGYEEYASRYSCDYVKNKASYDVYYWRNVRRNDPSDEEYIASVTGLSACRSSAVSYARSINEEWNNRSYICVLKERWSLNGEAQMTFTLYNKSQHKAVSQPTS